MVCVKPLGGAYTSHSGIQKLQSCLLLGWGWSPPFLQDLVPGQNHIPASAPMLHCRELTWSSYQPPGMLPALGPGFPAPFLSLPLQGKHSHPQAELSKGKEWALPNSTSELLCQEKLKCQPKVLSSQLPLVSYVQLYWWNASSTGERQKDQTRSE